MLAAENSRKRIHARSPAAATSAGNADELMGTSWFMAQSCVSIFWPDNIAIDYPPGMFDRPQHPEAKLAGNTD
jgi:hypothetical protein